MAGQGSKKLKLYYLSQILERYTDQDHPLTIAEILTELEKRGIHAERKCIYDDLEALRSAGMDIIRVRGRCNGYYLGERRFEAAELKLLADIVQSSQFLTARKTEALLRKIEGLGSVYEAKTLRRRLYVSGRVKSMNESVFYNIDELSRAISANQCIRFQYLGYTLNREQKLRRDGAFYELSPYMLIWNQDRYYLLGWDEAAQCFKHFRVDRMVNIRHMQKERSGQAQFEHYDLNVYGRGCFDMFTGEEKQVTLRFHSSLINPVVDRFGRDVPLQVEDEEHVLISVKVVVSPKFYSWLFAYGGGAEIVEPADVREGMEKLLRETAERYGMG